MGWILGVSEWSRQKKILAVSLFGAFLIPSIFLSYSKTSILGLLFALSVFSFLTYKYIYRKKITQRFYGILAGIFFTPIILIAIFKWELFLHLGSVLNRVDNLSKSVEMFFYNPFGYGLGIAGPASQIGNSIESAGSWEIAATTTYKVHKFLPENWYVQIFLEQ
jgi:hypothetical protein